MQRKRSQVSAKQNLAEPERFFSPSFGYYYYGLRSTEKLIRLLLYFVTKSCILCVCVPQFHECASVQSWQRRISTDFGKTEHCDVVNTLERLEMLRPLCEQCRVYRE